VYIRTYIYPFNGPLSGTTGVSRYHKGKTIWILLKQEAVSGSGIVWAICKPAPRSRQITMPAPHHSVFYRPDALPAAQPTASKHWRHGHFTYYYICTNIAVNFLEKGNEIAVMSRTEVACVTLHAVIWTWYASFREASAAGGSLWCLVSSTWSPSPVWRSAHSTHNLAKNFEFCIIWVHYCTSGSLQSTFWTGYIVGLHTIAGEYIGWSHVAESMDTIATLWV